MFLDMLPGYPRISMERNFLRSPSGSPADVIDYAR